MPDSSFFCLDEMSWPLKWETLCTASLWIPKCIKGKCTTQCTCGTIVKLLISHSWYSLEDEEDQIWIVRGAERIFMVSRIDDTIGGCCRIDCHGLHNHSRSKCYSPSTASDIPTACCSPCTPAWSRMIASS